MVKDNKAATKAGERSSSQKREQLEKESKKKHDEEKLLRKEVLKKEAMKREQDLMKLEQDAMKLEQDAYYEIWLFCYERRVNAVLLSLAALLMFVSWSYALPSINFQNILVVFILCVLYFLGYDFKYILWWEDYEAPPGIKKEPSSDPTSMKRPGALVRPARGPAVLVYVLCSVLGFNVMQSLLLGMQGEAIGYFTLPHMGVTYAGVSFRNIPIDQCREECSKEFWCEMTMYRTLPPGKVRSSCVLYDDTPEQRSQQAVPMRDASLSVKKFVKDITISGGKLYYLTQAMPVDKHCKGCLQLCEKYFKLASVGKDLQEVEKFYNKGGGTPLLYHYTSDVEANLGSEEWTPSKDVQWVKKSPPWQQDDVSSLRLLKDTGVTEVSHVYSKLMVKALCEANPLNIYMQTPLPAETPSPYWTEMYARAYKSLSNLCHAVAFLWEPSTYFNFYSQSS